MVLWFELETSNPEVVDLNPINAIGWRQEGHSVIKGFPRLKKSLIAPSKAPSKPALSESKWR